MVQIVNTSPENIVDVLLLYECDADKNTTCGKDICHECDGCYLTVDPGYAMLDDYNKPKVSEIRVTYLDGQVDIFTVSGRLV